MKPWYRHIWPWLIMLPPGVSVVGGVVVLCLALASPEPLVAEDYYRQGITINERLARERSQADCPAKDRACAERLSGRAP